MLTDQERLERDVAALQQELLAIEKTMSGIDIVESTQAYHEAKTRWETDKAKLKWLKERRSAIQSTLKSVSQF